MREREGEQGDGWRQKIRTEADCRGEVKERLQNEQIEETRVRESHGKRRGAEKA